MCYALRYTTLGAGKQAYFVDLLDCGAHYSMLPPPDNVYVTGSQRERNALYLRVIIARERRAQVV